MGFRLNSFFDVSLRGGGEAIKKQIDLSVLKRDKSKSALLNFCFSATDLFVEVK
jgi:hypothetical protein